MNFFKLKSQFSKTLAALTLTALLVAFGVLYQNRALDVRAEVQVLLVSDTYLPFGNVFPGENHSKTYTVSLDTTSSSSTYQTVLTSPVGLPADDPLFGRQNLCPLMSLTPVDAEGDTLAAAHLTDPGDSQDSWRIELNVPAMRGMVAQDHRGGIIVTGGDYGCKITVTTDLGGGGEGGCEGADCGGGGGNATGTDVSVVKTVDKLTPNEGETITYTGDVANSGPDTATSVKLTEMLPADVTFVSATTSTGTYDSLLDEWFVGDMAAGQHETITLVASVKTGTAGHTIVNEMQVSSGSFDPNLSNNKSSATSTVPTPGGGGGGGGCVVDCGGTGGGGGGGGGGGTTGEGGQGGGGGGGAGSSTPQVLGSNTNGGGGVPKEPAILGATDTLPDTGVPPVAVALLVPLAYLITRRWKRA